MPKTRREVLALVHEFRERLAAFYGPRLKWVYLYGSYARGEADEDSDIDIAIVLDGPVDRSEERWRTNDIASELSLREDCLLNTVFLSEDELRRRPYAIHRSISREGVAV
jgi:type I restriction enzyme S subunit